MTEPRESGSRHYIENVARANLGGLIDTWNGAAAPEKAGECAQLAVAHGIWSHAAQRHRDHVPGLAAKPLHDPAGWWFLGLIEERFPEIRAEILAAGDCVLFQDGAWDTQACAPLPVTRAVLEQIPEVTTFNPGAIRIRRLPPGTHLMPHCGTTNAILRVFLPISGGDGGWMRVARETIGFTEGRAIVLDDSFEREIKHEGQADLVLLILDMAHPGLDPAHRARLLTQRATAAERLAAFLRERGIEAVSYRDGELVLHPGEEMRRLIFQYTRAAGVTGVEVDGDRVRWLQAGAETG